jgi:probable Rubsico expression protein CbbX
MSESTQSAGGFGMSQPGSSEAGAAAADANGAGGGEPETLSPDATLDLSRVQRDAAADEVLERMDGDLVGLEPVKTRIREIASLLIIDGARRRFGLGSSPPTLHMSFTGSPGTGKTTVALRMAELLKGLGFLRKGHLITATREDMVGEYIGHTAPKTKQMIAKALGGVLFIDEAYSLHRAENERDYGQEAIEILLQAMENQREDLVVIFAGYSEPMRRFFGMNTGLASRVAHHIEFPDYTTDELMAIASKMLDEESYELTEEADATFRRYLEHRRAQPNFANARSVRNALERARLRHANRLVRQGGEVSREDLTTLTANEFLKSRVLQETGDEEEDATEGESV